MSRIFKNLMHVYLDAVFFPNIYEKEEIFRQEGWHYELENTDSPLTLNGVVYNEMKGAFSSPEDVLEREIFNSLFPNTPYGVESGGDPQYIPDLKYSEIFILPQPLLSSGKQLHLSVWKYGYGRTPELDG